MEMLTDLFRPPRNDIWTSDVDRLTRRIEELKLKVSRREARAGNYKEMRLILKEVALLEGQLQNLITEGKYGSEELLRRTELLRYMNAEVKKLDSVIVGDGHETGRTPATSSSGMIRENEDVVNGIQVLSLLVLKAEFSKIC